ncbi:glycosyltransferase [Desulfobulbus rhabdoformis]|uniref:glycosyltransferase family 2 protein n=1 Tax=Desulfobulbus rhabdoformis TaxID=34032 RepID=UPI0019637A29|nr:glycosyltransferase family 2 protein [Desulfobulbus rhabdoformis]MBM9614402.1 glycosyltransferase [Desulfobulbus rhabdoformis]
MGLLNILPPPPSKKINWPWTRESNQHAPKKIDGGNWPRISIVTPSYNQGCYIEETIRSVLLQNYPNLEYIIIDGGSTDESVEIIKKYEPWLTYWGSEPDRGQSHAINKGFARCSGDILGWLCSDDILLNGSLEFVANNMKLDSSCWMIGGVKGYDERSGVTFCRPIPQSFGMINFLLWQSMSIAQPSVFWTRHLLDVTGSLHEDLHYCMDQDLWLRFFRVVPPTFAGCYLSRYRRHENAKTTSYSHHYQKLLTESSSWLLDVLNQESHGSRRTETVEALMEMQRRAIAWQRLKEHIVIGRILKWWQKFINHELPTR